MIITETVRKDELKIYEIVEQDFNTDHYEYIAERYVYTAEIGEREIARAETLSELLREIEQ